MAKGKGGGGGGGGNIKLDLFIEGKRSDVSISVRLFQGNTPKAGEFVKFWAGTDNNPYKAMLQRPAGTDWVVTIGNNGVGTGRFDLSTFKVEDFKSLTAEWNGRTSQPKPLPVEVDVPGKAPSAKRLKVLPENQMVESMRNRYDLDIMTFNLSGKNPEHSTVQLRSDNAVTIVNRDNGNIIAPDIKFVELNTIPSGILAIEISFRGLERKISLTHPTGERIERNLSFR